MSPKLELHILICISCRWANAHFVRAWTEADHLSYTTHQWNSHMVSLGGIDFAGTISSCSQSWSCYVYILTVSDNFIQLAWAKAMPTKKAVSVVLPNSSVILWMELNKNGTSSSREGEEQTISESTKILSPPLSKGSQWENRNVCTCIYFIWSLKHLSMWRMR